jgi:uncharacterized membrane protein YgcG
MNPTNERAAGAAQCLVDMVNDAILFPLIALMSAIAFLVFLWGAFQYVKNADSDAARAQGQQHMLWGVIGLLVMVSAYAILNIATGTFGLGIDVPEADCSSVGSAGPGGTTGGQTGGSGGGQTGGSGGGQAGGGR